MIPCKGSTFNCLYYNLVRTLCKCWFHTLLACFSPYIFLAILVHVYYNFDFDPTRTLSAVSCTPLLPHLPVDMLTRSLTVWCASHEWWTETLWVYMVVHATTGANISQLFTPYSCCPPCAFNLALYLLTCPVPIFLFLLVACIESNITVPLRNCSTGVTSQFFLFWCISISFTMASRNCDHLGCFIAWCKYMVSPPLVVPLDCTFYAMSL